MSNSSLNRLFRQPEMRSYKPSLREMFGNKVYDVAKMLGFPANRMRNEAQFGVDFVPGAGDVLGFQDAYRDYDAGNYLGAGIGVTAAALGLVPGAGDALAKGVKKAEEPIRKGIRAYHGSPHDFDKFSMDKIGTGEGAQAYGHGLYFAEDKDVAQFYKDNYAKPSRAEFSTDNARQLAQDQLQAWAGDIEGGIRDLEASLGNAKIGRLFGDADEGRIKDLSEAIDYMKRGAPSGRMYEVNINANPDDFLDWDAPLSEQSESALSRLREVLEKSPSHSQDPDLFLKSDNLTPGQLITDLGRGGLDPESIMAQKGIPGVKYKDANSRGADGGNGTRNYVVFDENLISIVKKYGIAGALAAGLLTQEQADAMAAQGLGGMSEAQAQNNRSLGGFFDPRTGER